MSIIIKPIVTEKVSSAEEFGRYGFVVDEKANKIEIKKAIESKYGVSVAAVNTIRYAGKAKRNKKTWAYDGRTSSYKKAIITVKPGEIIDIYSNI
jgi:large subunit ribosomal protein L23